MKYLYVPLTSHKSYPDDWHTIHTREDEMFEKPIYGETLAEAQKLLDEEKKTFPPAIRKEFNFKIEKIPMDSLTTFRKKKGTKAKPKRTIKKCKCK